MLLFASTICHVASRRDHFDATGILYINSAYSIMTVRRAFVEINALPIFKTATDLRLTAKQHLQAMTQPGHKVMENALWEVSYQVSLKCSLDTLSNSCLFLIEH